LLLLDFCTDWKYRSRLTLFACVSYCISSRNGSPLETTEKGSVIATVTKKRRGNESANFEINVGEGKYISLSDPNGVQELDSEMKATAATQLKVLQDQMASLMAQLTK
jgi:Cell division cycle-associated protein 8